VRAALPFLNHLCKVVGDEKAEEFLLAMKIDPDFFVNLDHQLSLNFILDLTRVIAEKAGAAAIKPEEMAASVSDPATHGLLKTRYKSLQGMGDLLTTLFGNALHYECNFRYAIEEQRGAELVVSVAPNEHLSAVRYKDDPALGDFLCQYKKHYFQTFSRMNGGPGATLHEKQCLFHGADRCVYQFRMGS
jgi:hypothetical protein